MTNIQDSAVAPNPPAAFPLQRPGWLTRALFKAGAGAYREPLARFMGSHAMLLLTTTGRRSRLPRQRALTFRDLGGSYLVLAGMGAGSDWYRNLLAQPCVRVKVGAQTFPATAEPVLAPEQRRMLAPCIATQWGCAAHTEIRRKGDGFEIHGPVG